MSKCIRIVAAGGITFRASLVEGDDSDYLGSMEFGTLSADGQYEQDDDEIIAAARAEFDVPESVPGVVL
ncbi:MAG: hypothetical protein EPN38_09325 [Rhodanobacteraceae bacterium]|nr:MAG: hypothetical protein EPN38_09325 [Rhodanobacteraceae bacterium]